MKEEEVKVENITILIKVIFMYFFKVNLSYMIGVEKLFHY